MNRTLRASSRNPLRCVADIALSPWWIAQLATKAKSFRHNPVLGNPTLNRWGLHTARRRVAARIAEWRRAQLAARVEPAERESFDHKGYFIRRNALSDEMFSAFLREIRAMNAPAREMRQGPAVTRHLSLDDTQLGRMPAVRSFVKDAGVRELIRYAASYGGEPTYSVQSIISNRPSGEPDPQTLLHADTFHPTAKAWLFLVDVAEDAGPFAYVPGSHRLTAARLAWEREQSLAARYSRDHMHSEGSFRIDEAGLTALGLPAPVRFAVPANTLIVADTSGFHARTPSTASTFRVEIYASLRRTPFIPWTGGHVIAYPPISGRHFELRMRALQSIERAGLGRSPWHPVGSIGAFDEAPRI